MIRLPNIGDRLRRVREVAQNVEEKFVNDEPGFVQVETMLKRYTSQLLSERNDASRPCMAPSLAACDAPTEIWRPHFYAGA